MTYRTAASSSPTAAPSTVHLSGSLSPSTKLPICLFGGYCGSTADCVAGAACSFTSASYSQCLFNSSYDSSAAARSGKCVLSFQSGCSSVKGCCNPGFVCGGSNPAMMSCSPLDSPSCSKPSSFPSTGGPSASPSAAPARSSTVPIAVASR